MISPPDLSVIVPVRTSAPEFYLERLRLRDSCDLTDTETVLADDGSPEEVADELQAFCADRGWSYIRLETSHLPFSLARTRNAGLSAATAEWVLFDDADMVYETTFFGKLLKELPLIEETPLDFLSLPAVYLQEEISREVLARGKIDELLPSILTQLAFEDPRGSPANRVIESFAPASAVLAMKKETALAVGAYDNSFVGWGGEDRDFIFRLLASNRNLPKPKDFNATRTWNLNDTHEFAGWRALFRLHGDYLARKGIYAFHLFHRPNAWRSEAGRENIEKAAYVAQATTASNPPEEAETPAQQRLKNSLLFSVYADTNRDQLRLRFYSERSKTQAWTARVRKMRRDPHAYFRDSRLPILRILRHFFQERENEADAKVG